MQKEGRSYRPLRPITKDEFNALFAAIMRGEHLLDGFRNRDIRETIDPGSQTQIEARSCRDKVGNNSLPGDAARGD